MKGSISFRETPHTSEKNEKSQEKFESDQFPQNLAVIQAQILIPGPQKVNKLS